MRCVFAYAGLLVCLLFPSVARAYGLTGSTSGAEGQSLSWTCTGNNQWTGYGWDFGDGATIAYQYDNAQTGSQSKSHAFVDSGTYTVQCSVGSWPYHTSPQAFPTVSVTIADTPPTVTSVTANPASAAEATAVTFTCSASDVANDAITQYSWNFGDGTTATTANNTVQHTFADPGSFDVQCTAKDEDGGQGSKTLAAYAVSNLPPTLGSFGGANDVPEGSPVTNACDVSDPGGGSITYTWNWGDGSPNGSGANPSHAYADNGSYTIQCTGTDGAGAAVSGTRSVTVTNANPTAVATVPSTASEGAPVSVSCAATDPGSADTHTFAWSFGDGGTATSADATHTYADEGTQWVSCAATDDDGGTHIHTKTISVQNAAPVISQLVGTANAKEGAPATFTCVATDAGVNDVLTWSWTFGDAETATTTTGAVTHTYAEPGSYAVTCAVADGDGGSTQQTLPAYSVSNLAPTLHGFSGDTNILEGGLVSNDCVVTDPGGGSISFTWVWGDGTAAEFGAGKSHVYADNATYAITCIAADAQGSAVSTTRLVNILNAPPIATASAPSTAIEGASVSMSCSAADAGSADTHTFSWDFGDGQSGTGADPVHTYADEGDWTVTCTVTDDDGGTHSHSRSISVQNAAPAIVSLEGGDGAEEGTQVAFTCTATDAGMSDVLTWTWDFGDGGTDETTWPTTTHTYLDDGTFSVACTVDDGDGGISMDELEVPVANVPPVAVATGPTSGNEGENLTYSCSVEDPLDETYTYAWAVDGLPMGQGSELTYAFFSEGTHDVTCVVTDDDGATGSDSVAVGIGNVPPVIDGITGASAGLEGDALSWTAVASDPAGDALTYAWSFGDGTDGAGATVTHAFADHGTFEVAVTVCDDSGLCDTDSVMVAVQNRGAQLLGVTIPAGGSEGEELTFSAIASEATGDPVTVHWTFGDGNTATGETVTHVFPDDATWVVVVTADDGEGGTDTESATVAITNVAPMVVEVEVDGDLDEGTLVSMSAVVTDPGGSDTHTLTWDFGDSETAIDADPEHAWLQDGPYTIHLTVCDDDGACSEAEEDVTVANVAPAVVVVSPEDADEGEVVAFDVEIADPGADTHAVTWDFGDGTTAAGASATHAFVDEGEFVVSVSVDDGGETSDAATTVLVANVAPQIEGKPASTVVEGSAYSYEPGADDPGVEDALVWSADAMPAGAKLNVATGKVSWQPSTADLGTHDLAIRLEDGDGGVDDKSWQVEVVLLDGDGDLVSDLWEQDNGLNPTDPADGALDPDGDGRDNLDEFLDGTDPNRYDGPDTPELLSPIGGEVWDEPTVVLTVGNVESAVGADLTYAFQVYSDAAMTQLVAEVEGVAAGDTTTSWDFDGTAENETYWWWAAAADSWHQGPWSAPEHFVFSLENDAPSAPHLTSPFDGSSVSSLSPVLSVDPATDPDGDEVTYGFALTDQAGNPITTATGVAGDETGAEWSVDVELVDGEIACWYAWATDALGLDGASSDTACFFVDLFNEPPSAPVILAPEDGSGVATTSPTIEVQNGVDPEGRDVIHLFELDTSPSFASADYRAFEVASDPSGVTSVVAESLADDAVWYVRVAATDGDAFSAPDQIWFSVNSGNGAPTAPALQNPADGGVLPAGEALSVVNAVDPDGDPLTYEFRVVDAEGVEVVSVEVDEGKAVTSFAPGLAVGDYRWTARAIDTHRLAGPWAEERGFAVPGTDDAGGPETTTGSPELSVGEGCDGCQSGSGPSPAMAVWLLLAVLFYRRTTSRGGSAR